MGHQTVSGRRVVRSGCAVARAAGAVIEGLEARCLLSAVLYVDDSAAGSGDGSSWVNAFTDLQLALSQAVCGDEIHIGAGTYRPTATTDRTVSFELKDGVSLLGGYAGIGAGDPDARDIVLFQTVLSGDIGADGVNADNSYHVIVSNNVSSMTVLEGVTITGGYADGDRNDSYGGGIYDLGSSLTLTNCTFSGNAANGSGDFDSGNGGGMYNRSSSPSLTNCIFSGNTANCSGQGGYGGGMCNEYYSSPTLVACTFSENTASGSGLGGGMYNDSSCSPTLADCTFSENTASGSGGGMYNSNSSSPGLTNCVFSGNTAIAPSGYGGFGGGMYDGNSSSPELTNCVFSGNVASSGGSFGGYGGGMYNSNSSSPTLTNCTFSVNVASGSGSFSGRGGGMFNLGTTSALTLTDCTFYGNIARSIGETSDSDQMRGYGGGIYSQYCSFLILTDCTFSGNVASGSGIASGYGGAAYIDSTGILYNSALPVLTNCTFSGNTASGIGDYGGYGGGMYNDGSSSATLAKCRFNGNTASGTGESSGYGGGIYDINSSSPVLTNCTFTGNTASGHGDSSGYGGGMYTSYSSYPWLTNCTLGGNTASGRGGGMYNSGWSGPTLANCIVWGSGARPIYNDDSSDSGITYSDIQGGYTGTHNIKVDPLFVRSPSFGPDGVWGTADDDYGDLRLQPGSPCIDAGTNEALEHADLGTDLAGNPRIINDTLDLGAYEGEVIDPIFGAKHPLKFSDTDNDTVTIGISGGGGGTLSPGNAIALTGTNSKSVLTIAVKKGVGGDGLFHISGITSEGPLKGINASAVVVSGRVLINTLNQDAGRTSVSLKFRTISEADVQIQGMPVASIAVSDAVSDSRIVTTGSIGKSSAAALLNSDILIGVATGFAGQFAGHGDFANPAAKLGSLKVTGQKLPKGQLAPAFVVNSDISAPSVETVSLVNVAATSDPIVHVMTDAGVLKVSKTKLVDEEMFGNGTWKKAGVRPGIWQVV